MATQTKVFNRKGRKDFREDRKGIQTKIWTASSNASSCLYVRDWQLREPSLLACSFPLLAERQLLTLPLSPSREPRQRQVRQPRLFPSFCLWLQRWQLRRQWLLRPRRQLLQLRLWPPFRAWAAAAVAVGVAASAAGAAGAAAWA